MINPERPALTARIRTGAVDRQVWKSFMIQVYKIFNNKYTTKGLICQTHTTCCFRTQINTNTQEICWTSTFTTLTTNTIFSSWCRCNLASFTTIPSHHFQYIRRTSSDTLCTTNASIIDFYSVRQKKIMKSFTNFAILLGMHSWRDLFSCRL